MGIFSDLLDGITITAKSPDGNIECDLVDGRHMEMGFKDGAYKRYSDPALEHQLAGLLTSLWVGHHQARLSVLSEEFDYLPREEHSTADRPSREFAQERKMARAQGRSDSGRITIETVGRSTWSVRVQAGTVSAMDEDGFLQDFWKAFLQTMAEFRHQMAQLKRDKFGEMDFHRPSAAR
ncbi:MAG: hypothetical protein ACRD1T_09640 [Acidimicrobiia bacterium]